jgi:formiminotetrahydrofolate cyclodeaminase
VAARVGLYAVSLLRMVLGITLRKVKESAAPDARRTLPETAGDAVRSLEELEARARHLAGDFEALEAEDMAAFEGYLEAMRLPRSTPEEKEARRAARARAALRATQSPLALMRAVRELLGMASAMLDLSRTTPLRAESDLGAAIELGHACSRVAQLNIVANLGELAEPSRTAVVKEWHELRQVLEDLSSSLRVRLEPPRP